MEEEINKLINNCNTDEECAKIYDIIKQLENDKYSDLPKLYYEFALVLFNNEFYEDSIKMFCNAYEQSYNKEKIKSFIYEHFINPNTEEFKVAYDDNIGRDGFNNFKVQYENLKLDFIPITNERYYIFDLEKETFNQVIDLNKENINIEKENTNMENFSDLILIDNEGDIQKLIQYINNIENRVIYYLSGDINKTMSFLKLANISETYLNNVVIFKDVTNMKNFFRTNLDKYLPRTIKSLDNDLIVESEIKGIIDKEHEFRILNEGRHENNILLSICIPTYNRGHRALENIRHLINSSYDTEIEFVVSNNGSTENVEEYNQIKKINDSRISYYEFDNNQGVLKNICKVLDVAKGKFALLLSDEDLIDLSSLPVYLKLLRNNLNLGFVLCGTTITYQNLKEKYIKAGDNAFLEIFMACNYITGMIYNTEKLHQYNLIENTIKNSNNLFCALYPHMWMNAFMSIDADIYICPTILCIEGVSERQENNLDYLQEKCEIEGMLKYSSYTSRIEQHNAIIQLINMIPFESKITMICVYKVLCWKTNFLPTLVKDKYVNSGYDWNEIYDELYKCCLDGIYKLDMEITPWAKQQFEESIKNDNSSFRN